MVYNLEFYNFDIIAAIAQFLTILNGLVKIRLSGRCISSSHDGLFDFLESFDFSLINQKLFGLQKQRYEAEIYTHTLHDKF